MHETLLSDVRPDFGHITQKVVLNLLLPVFFLDVLPIESLWDMALIGFLPVFLVHAFFPNAPNDLCDGVHGQHCLFSENFGHNGLPVLHLNIPPEHSDKLSVYHLRIDEVTTDSAKKQSTLYVEAKTFQHDDAKVVFNVSSWFSITMNGGGVSGDNGGGRSLTW